MLNKKISRMLGPVLGIMVFATSLGVGQVKILADDNVNKASEIYENAISEKDKDYFININKSVEQNGVKVTLEKAIATKHDLKLSIKIKSEKPFDIEKMERITAEVTYGEIDINRSSQATMHLDENTILIYIDQSTYEDEMLEKGELRIDLIMPQYKVNAGIDAYVDFSESFKNTIEKDINAKIPEFDFTLNKLVSSVMGTKIFYTAPYKEFDDINNNPAECSYSIMVLKAGERMYTLNQIGGHSFGDDLVNGTYISEGATYDKIKDAKNISIIPLICYMTQDEMDEIYKSEGRVEIYEKMDKLKEIKDNVRYLKSFEFSDGSKGEIYNIERNDDVVKVYCKCNLEKETLLMVNNIDMYQELDDNIFDVKDMYDSSTHMSFYKDSNDSLGYIVEFSNVPKDKIMNINIDSNISKIDKYEIGNEVELSK
ncbi:DUF4179 domain-containing protein [uncultured Clostridium sp.]|uniref:DUF4179 domain-containing protein n=1 Tax=uncultured Clostridium sp. TaxID=59620 RepID=UPI0028EAB1DA|nr:DUF4179 domain-containing protein [uncultured Clostridium sp.]